jgi:hypothetical protein
VSGSGGIFASYFRKEWRAPAPRDPALPRLPVLLATASLDPATYAGRLVLGGPDDLTEAAEVLEKLLEGYGDRPRGLSWYLATCILRRSTWPFRSLDEHWPERVEGVVEAAETALVGSGVET